MKTWSTPIGYLHQRSTKALHWQVYEVAKNEGIFEAKKPSMTTACGAIMDARGWKTRVTVESRFVTCWACAQKARAAGLPIHKPGEDR